MKALLIIFITGIFSLFTALFSKQKQLVTSIVLLGIVTALISISLEWNNPTFEFVNMMRFDHYYFSFAAVILLATLLIALFSGHEFRSLVDTIGDNYGLILFSLCGALLMLSFENLMMLFLGIEILSIPLYVLAGSRKNDLASNEAALKYFLMGSFATGILLFGIALVFGATGKFTVDGLIDYVHLMNGSYSTLFTVGILLMMIGLSFKVSAAPFHFWSPDVYHGSPNLITTYMSTVVKAAGFAAFFKLFAVAFGEAEGVWSCTLAAISALTMIIGNVTALYQTNFKRLMAYSSIAHAGYLILGLLGLKQISSGAILIYLLAYSLATIVAFGVFMLVYEKYNENANIETFNGLAKSNPFLAFVMTVALFSLAGIPPAAGFFGKYFLFTQAFDHYAWLVVVAILMSAVSIAYYFKIIIAMYFKQSDDSVSISIPITYSMVFVVAVLLIFGISLNPELILNIVQMQ
ncbi:MAG: NADH-quinone oxidoreductase subunit N [Saprospiraceae bacterium]|nr:NADH-quinone oxidoreductase subunit N [Saprospiraceae bacterium]